VRIRVPGWAAVQIPGGGLVSNEIVDVDDSDEETLAFWANVVADGCAAIVDEPKAAAEPKAEVIQPDTSDQSPKRGPGRPRKQTAK
jgi:hypothetical protein